MTKTPSLVTPDEELTLSSNPVLRKAPLRRIKPILLALPAITLLAAYTAHYATNATFQDQWGQAQLLLKAHGHRLSFFDLWAQHNENRMLFPNLISLFFGETFGTQNMTAIWASFTLQSTTYTILLTLLYRMHTRRRFYAIYVPATFLVISTTYWEDSLWSFQLAWFLIIFCLFVAIAILSIINNRLVSTALIGIVITVASFSSIQGLLLAPSLAIAAWLCRKTRALYAIAVIGGTDTVLYFYHFHFTQTGAPPIRSPITHLIHTVLYLPVLVGSTIPSEFPQPQILYAQGAFGTLLLVVAAFQLWHVFRHRPTELAVVLGTTVLIFGLGFSVMTAAGRSMFPLVQAESSRYTLYTLLVPLGELLLASGIAARKPFSYWQHAFTAALGASATLGALFIPLAIAGANAYYSVLLQSELIQANWRTASNQQIVTTTFPDAALVRTTAAALDRLSLDGFGSTAFEMLTIEGPNAPKPTTAPLPLPATTPGLSGQEQHTWDLLSAIYYSRNDLKSAFGPPDNSKLTCHLLAWATTQSMPGSHDSSAPLLRAFRKSIFRLRADLC